MAKSEKTTKKPQETAKHIAAFWAWYELERNFKETSSKVIVSEPSLAKWIKAFDWHKRADDLDAKQFAKAQQLLIEKNGKRTAEMIENHYKLGTNLIAVGGTYLFKNGVDNGGQAIQAAKVGVDIQRTAEGLATAKTETEHSGEIGYRLIEPKAENADI